MAELKLKIKKCGLVRKLDNEKVKGYYGKVITNGKATFDEIAGEGRGCPGKADQRNIEQLVGDQPDGVADVPQGGWI